MRIRASLLTLYMLAHCTCVIAPATAKDDNTDPAALEKKYFGHVFQNETVEERTVRIEKMVFGEPQPGDLHSRLQRLNELGANVEDSQQAQSQQPVDSQQRVDSQSRDSQSRLDSQSQFEQSTSEQDLTQNSDEESSSGSNYPHITALEKVICGQAFETDKVPDRLARMETKAFGKPSNDPDLAKRTDELDQYARKNLHYRPIAKHPEAEEYQQARNIPATSGAPAGAGGRPAMPGLSKQLVAMAANTLLGAAGLGGASTALGLGLAAMNARDQQEAARIHSASQAAAQSNQYEEDPAAYTKSPPAQGAKMLTKVAWCEAHIFGVTFPGLHLPKRLRQLSQELGVASEKSDFQLMDEVDAMVKLVEVRQKPLSTAESGARQQ